MTASLAHQLLSDNRSVTLRRSDRAVLKTLATIARDDGRPKWPVRHKTIAERAGYSVDAVRKSLRRLSGRDKDRPDLQLVAVEPGTGHESSRYTVALTWDEKPPRFLPRNEPVPDVPERPKTAPAPAEQEPRKPQRPRPSLAEIAPHGGPWFPDETPSEPPPLDDEEDASGEVVELLAPPDADDVDTWCEDARRLGKPHRGRRCCGMTARQLKDKEEKDRRAAARTRELEEFRANFGRESKANAMPSEEALEKNREYAAVRAAIRKGKVS